MRVRKEKNKKSFSYKLKAAINKKNLTQINMEQLSDEKRLKHFQLALSMVGVTANLMTCELIHSLAHAVDQKGSAFSLGDAEVLAELIQAKYQAMPMGMPPGMVPPANIPPDLKKMMEEGKIMMGKTVASDPTTQPQEEEPRKETGEQLPVWGNEEGQQEQPNKEIIQGDL